MNCILSWITRDAAQANNAKYASLTAQKMKFSIKDFFIKCDMRFGHNFKIWLQKGLLPVFPL